MISFYHIKKGISLDLITPDKGTIDEDDSNITISEEYSPYKNTIDEDNSNNTISEEDSLTNIKKPNPENYSNIPKKIFTNHSSSTLVDSKMTEMKGNILLGKRTN